MTTHDPRIATAEETEQRVRALAVNMNSFARALGYIDGGSALTFAVYRIVHGRSPTTAEEFAAAFKFADLPARLPYGTLLDALPGTAALLALEHIDEDINYAMDVLICEITLNFTLPILAGYKHPAYEEAARLNTAYRLWADRRSGSCEQYALAAATFRKEYLAWNRETGIWRPLLEALPTGGVDDRCADGPRPAQGWQSLGRFMADMSDEGKLIETLREHLELDDPTDEEDINDEAWWNRTLDERLDEIRAEKLADYDETLKELILATLAACIQP